MDELSEYLTHHYPNNYISGYKDCNLLLWGKDGTTPKMFSLVMGIEYDPYLGDENISGIMNRRYFTENTFKRLMLYGKEIAKQNSIPFIVLIYPSLNEKYGEKWAETENVYDRNQVLFYWFEFTKAENKFSHTVMRGYNLKKKIHDTIGVNYVDEGTSKLENSHLSDYFHYWSRETLSKRITKLDIDGMLINNDGDKGVLIEIKRSSKPPIPKWKPNYDKANYMLESNFAKRISAYFWLLHHESRPCNDEDIISFYVIDRVNETREVDFVISNDIVLEMKVREFKGDCLVDRIEKFICGGM